MSRECAARLEEVVWRETGPWWPPLCELVDPTCLYPTKRQRCLHTIFGTRLNKIHPASSQLKLPFPSRLTRIPHPGYSGEEAITRRMAHAAICGIKAIRSKGKRPTTKSKDDPGKTVGKGEAKDDWHKARQGKHVRPTVHILPAKYCDGSNGWASRPGPVLRWPLERGADISRSPFGSRIRLV